MIRNTGSRLILLATALLCLGMLLVKLGQP
jgi:hypothetical protein